MAKVLGEQNRLMLVYSAVSVLSRGKAALMHHATLYPATCKQCHHRISWEQVEPKPHSVAGLLLSGVAVAAKLQTPWAHVCILQS